MDIKDAGQIWGAMHDEWKAAYQDARMARHELTLAFGRCVAGQGAGPTEAEIERTTALERRADELRLAEDAFLKGYFG